jgi:hypothetical protein
VIAARTLPHTLTRCVARAVSLSVIALLAACSHTRVAERTTPPANVDVTPRAAPPSEVPPPPPQIAPPVSVGDQPPPTGDKAASATVAETPPCIPAPPKLKRKSKPHEEPRAPPQPQNPGTGAAPPPGAVVDAQLGETQSTVMSILGKKVRSPKGEDLGRVVDVLADAGGGVRVAIIDFGGFLGVGTRRIAVDWALLRIDPGAGDKPLILDLSREKLQSAPEYKDSPRPRVLMPSPAAAPAAATDAAASKK